MAKKKNLFHGERKPFKVDSLPFGLSFDDEMAELGYVTWEDRNIIFYHHPEKGGVSDFFRVIGDKVEWVGGTVASYTDNNFFSVLNLSLMDFVLYDARDELIRDFGDYYAYRHGEDFIDYDITHTITNEASGYITSHIDTYISQYLPVNAIDRFIDIANSVNRRSSTKFLYVLDNIFRENHLGIGESPLEDKLYHEVPHEIRRLLIPQYEIGRCHVDFAIPDKMIVIEVDGYNYHSSCEQVDRDNKRDEYIKSVGFKVVRIKGKDVFYNMDKVTRRIKNAIKNH